MGDWEGGGKREWEIWREGVREGMGDLEGGVRDREWDIQREGGVRERGVGGRGSKREQRGCRSKREGGGVKEREG